MRYNHHKITNFSKHASLWEKIKGNIIFAIGITKYTRRSNFLTRYDRKKFKQNIKPADLILIGNHRHISAFFVRGIVTHALLYVRDKKVIHSTGDGVEESSYKEIFKHYDTLIILRPKNINEDKIKKTIDFAKKQLDKPFNYDLKQNEDHFFCTQLINSSYLEAGIDTGLPRYTNIDSILDNPLHAVKFLNDKFDIIYVSKSVRRDIKDKFKFNSVECICIYEFNKYW